MNAEEIEKLMDRVHMGNVIPWDDYSAEDQAAIDDALAKRAAKYVDAGDPVRMSICINERRRRPQ